MSSVIKIYWKWEKWKIIKYKIITFHHGVSSIFFSNSSVSTSGSSSQRFTYTTIIALLRFDHPPRHINSINFHESHFHTPPPIFLRLTPFINHWNWVYFENPYQLQNFSVSDQRTLLNIMPGSQSCSDTTDDGEAPRGQTVLWLFLNLNSTMLQSSHSRHHFTLWIPGQICRNCTINVPCTYESSNYE